MGSARRQKNMPAGVFFLELSGVVAAIDENWLG
jgi:hypothetical protein